MKAIIAIVAFIFLWCIACNIQQSHKIQDLEVENGALKQMAKECR